MARSAPQGIASLPAVTRVLICRCCTSLDYSSRLEPANSAFDSGGFSPLHLRDALGAQNITYRIYGEAEYLQSLYLLIVKYFGPQSSLAAKMQSSRVRRIPRRFPVK